MPSADLSEGFSGLKQWSEPVIYDRLIAAYFKLISDRELARSLTRVHARVWRALIGGDMEGFEELRESLVGALEPCSLTLDHLAQVDGEIMIELLDVVMARYKSSNRTARAYHIALIACRTIAAGAAGRVKARQNSIGSTGFDPFAGGR
jgi:hypothetical protein